MRGVNAFRTADCERSAQRGALALACALLLPLGACSGEGVSGPGLSPAAREGRTVYLATCIACHNTDPNLPGPVGPDIAGSSRELVEARVLRGEYPPGYTPKRTSRAMVPLPHLEGKIDALTAYLDEVKEG
ncbi:MAG: cytochrome c [Deltaproteobacteria bacterium]|nr:MAG: cytochrome c [Deltaproteobacteria bacterium]